MTDKQPITAIIVDWLEELETKLVKFNLRLQALFDRMDVEVQRLNAENLKYWHAFLRLSE